MIIIESRKKKIEKLQDMYPGASIIDVTSKATDEFVKLSPFFPWGNIPVPFSPEWMAESVEGIWQGLKVFEHYGVDVKVMRVMGMTDIKRTTKKFGNILGHQKGMESNELLGYIDARKQIYVPAYFWVLENRCKPLLEKILDLSRKGVVVLLDYDLNADIDDPSSPLSHASLIVRYLSRFITEEERAQWTTQEEEMLKARKVRKKAVKNEKEAKQERWEERILAGNPSPYNPLWVKEKRKDSNVDFVFFWSHRAPKGVVTKACFSQWYPCSFEVDGETYNCAEQYMMAEKARVFDDEEIRRRILSESDPDTIKQLGREVHNFDPEVWDQHKFDVVVRGNLAKFGQNPDLKSFLKNTGSRILVEASPYDRIWGIGMREGQEGCTNPEKWFGTNLLGFALMVVRDSL